MTKFEQIGVNYQLDCSSAAEARKCFKLSCRSCCNRGMRIECDRCAISQAHDSIVAAFATYNNRSKEIK